MRTTLWLLLVLNGLAAAAWLAGFSVPPKPVANVAISTTPSAIPLQLLSELPALPSRLDALPADFEAPPGEPEGDSLLPAEPAAPEVAETSASAAEVVAGASQAPAVSPVPGQATEKPADRPLPASKVADAVAPSLAVPERPVEAATAPAIADEPADDAPACYRTPILAADAYEAVGAVLRVAELGEPTLQPQGRARARHWVYWAGATNELAGIEERLKAAGVRDWYRLPVTEGMSRISLGVYGQADGARRRQRELAAKAVQTQVRERYTPPAKLRWTVNARPAAVAAATGRLQRLGVHLEPCP